MKNKLIKLLLFFFFFSFFFNCKSKNVNQIEDKNNITFLSTDIIKTLYNQDKSLLLIIKYKEDGNIPTTFNYKVKNIKSNKIVKEGLFIGRKIEWYDNSSLKCIEHVGIIREENSRLSTIENSKKTKNYTIVKIYNN
ncbi:MAG: hypothetical protein ABJH82_12895 [Polaribacter sp.]|uniref:hypothetical protein n=1 Tax=Polaribacter sp. TaxID=1920175 RepID=UPI0032671BA6